MHNTREEAKGLLRHGDYLSPLYAPLPGQPVLVNTADERPEGRGNVLRRYRKDAEVSHQVQALGWIKCVHSHAIEYTGRVESLRGLLFAVGAIFILLMLPFGGYVLLSLIDHLKEVGVSPQPWYHSLPFAIVCVVALLMLGAMTAFSVTLARIELFFPADQPVIFDRRNRKVYRLFQELPDGVGGLFKRRPMKACAYEWDFVDAEHQGEVMITGAIAQSNHTLMFHVRRSEHDPTIIDSFEIGNAMSLSGDLVDAMWEHIRRFMEEDGPHLPSPDEPLARQRPPQIWWQSLGATGFIGAGYLGRWERQPGFMALMHVLAPVTVPLALLWGTGNWLSHRTEVEVKWPAEVLAAVGVPHEQSPGFR